MDSIIKAIEASATIYIIIVIALFILWICAMFAILTIRDNSKRIENNQYTIMDKQDEQISHLEEINSHLRVLEAYVINKMK